MCGRVVQSAVRDGQPQSRAPPRPTNGAPTDTLPVVRVDRDRRRSLDLLRWAWFRGGAKDIKIGARCINAVAETVATKPAFRDAFARRQRCIVPVDAFYEWKKRPPGKQPYAIVGADGLPLAMAGLWERWKNRRARGQSGRVALDGPAPVPGGIDARLSGRRARGERAEQRCRVAR